MNSPSGWEKKTQDERKSFDKILESDKMCVVNYILPLSAKFHLKPECWSCTYLVMVNLMNGSSPLAKTTQDERFR
jgi:hypothetical protein